MTIVNTTTIVGSIPLPNDTAPENSRVLFTLNGFDTDAGDDATIIPETIPAAIDASGDISVSLWPNPDGVRTTYYRVEIEIPAVNVASGFRLIDLGLIEVPSTGGPYDLNDLLPIAPPPDASVEDYIAQLQAAVASTTASAASAAADASSAASSAAAAALFVYIYFDDIAEFTADTSLTYTAGQAGTVSAGDLVLIRSDGIVLEIAASGASDNHETTAGGVKAYEAGTRYSTFSRFEDANTRAIFGDTPNGTVAQVGGQKYVRDTSQTFIPGLAGWRFAWHRQKHLLSADWQPRPEALSPGEAARFQGVLDSIANRHPDLQYAHVLGDLVHTATVDSTGAAPEYGFPEFLTDCRNRLPMALSSIYFLSGNHDADGFGAGNFENANSMRTYRSFIGREYYYTVQGNLMWIYMGDMGAANGGSITNAVVAWLDYLVNANKDKNIIIGIHQPLSGTYLGQTDVSNPDNVQALSSRITDILDAVAADADNIAAVFFGHVGSANQFNDETHHGTRHIQIGMHIPSNVDNARNDQYYIMELVHGSTTFDVVQWDATADVELVTKSITLTYPLQLGSDFVHDGRLDDDAAAPLIAPQEVNVPLDNYRFDNGGTWEVQTTPIPVSIIGATDRSNDDVPDGVAIAQKWNFPGTTTGSNAAQAAADGYHEGAGLVLFEKVDGTQDDPTLMYQVQGFTSGTIGTFFTSDDNGIHYGHDGQTTANPGNTTGTVGATINNSGFISASRNGVVGYLNRESQGDVLEFNYQGTRTGSIRQTNLTFEIQFQTNGPKITSGTGTPEGNVSAPVGSTYHRSDGGAGTSFYVKESGTGDTGWVAK